MATSILQDRRSIRADGIVARQECELLDNGTWRVRDTATGSGRWHSVFNGHCTCYDYLQRGSHCKHLRAVDAEEQALAQYGAAWDAQVDEARAAVVFPISETQNLGPHSDRSGVWYKGFYYTADELAAAEQARQNLLPPVETSSDLPGHFLDTDLSAFDDSSLTAEDLEWLSDDVNRDVPSNGYGADGWPEQRCPDCGSPLESRHYYVGGKGYTFVKVCTRDSLHATLAG